MCDEDLSAIGSVALLTSFLSSLQIVEISASQIISIMVDLKVDLGIAVEIDVDLAVNAKWLYRLYWRRSPPVRLARNDCR